jgi:hypothetical protein
MRSGCTGATAMTGNVEQFEVVPICDECRDHISALDWMGRYYGSEIKLHKLMAALEECAEIASHIRQESVHRMSYSKSEIARNNAKAAEIATCKIVVAIEKVIRRARREKNEI